MSHFEFEKLLTELTRMDTPMKNGPMMRWQRKAMETGERSKSTATPLSPRPNSAKTPSRSTKTPLKSRDKLGKTPKKMSASNRTPHKGSQDRFIPNRSTTDVDRSHFAIMTDENEENSNADDPYKQQLSDAMSLPQDAKILSFKEAVPKAAEGHLSSHQVLYSSSKAHGNRPSTSRIIPQTSERVLDAPCLLDDYYLNLLDWSALNHLAVALGPAVYIWNAGTSSIVPLMEMQEQDEYVSSVNWVKEGNILAVGTSIGSVQLWDVAHQKLVRTMTGHAARVGSLAWNYYICTSGSRSGVIHHHDVRVADHHVATLANHTQEVCGLSWSPDGRYLASGGNDNLLNIWNPSLGSEVVPVLSFTHHQAAVKAVCWCPWHPQLLASGGGTADRMIRFWNVSTGSCLNAVDAQSQVCSILFSPEHKELISGHGYSQNQLTIWKYPSMMKLIDLTGHTGRVLCLAMSPDGSTVASAAADECIRLWKCFEKDKTPKTVAGKENEKASRGLGLHRTSIR